MVDENKISEKIVKIVCPICKAEKELAISTEILKKSKTMTTISIQRNEICEHHFQAFIDKNFIVRGYQKVDFEIETKPKIPKIHQNVKIIIIGDFKAGKSAISRRFVEDLFDENYLPTLQLKISRKNLNLDYIKFTLIIWDIGGQVIHMSPYRDQFYEDAQLAIIVVDRTRKKTLENVKNWYKDTLSFISSKIPFIIVGNKSDLFDEITVTEEDLKYTAHELEADYILTSAKTGCNINKLFLNLTNLYLEQMNST